MIGSENCERERVHEEEGNGEGSGNGSGERGDSEDLSERTLALHLLLPISQAWLEDLVLGAATPCGSDWIRQANPMRVGLGELRPQKCNTKNTKKGKHRWNKNLKFRKQRATGNPKIYGNNFNLLALWQMWWHLEATAKRECGPRYNTGDFRPGSQQGAVDALLRPIRFQAQDLGIIVLETGEKNGHRNGRGFWAKKISKMDWGRENSRKKEGK